MGVCCGPVLADDLNPPDWRGEEGSTLQIWEFFTDANPTAPDVDQNPYGVATAEVTGEFPFTRWLASDPVKYIRIQLTLSTGEEDEAPAHLAILAGGEEVPADQITFLGMDPIGDYYYHATYDIMIEPNPLDETIFIQPRFCTLYVDEIVVDTICVPEPAGLLLLAVAGLLVRRR